MILIYYIKCGSAAITSKITPSATNISTAIITSATTFITTLTTIAKKTATCHAMSLKYSKLLHTLFMLL